MNTVLLLFLLVTVQITPMNVKDTKKLPSVIGMMLHIVRHSRPDLMNPTRELSSHMSNVVDGTMEDMDLICYSGVATTERGANIKPNIPGLWDGTRNYLFKIFCESNAN